MKKKTTKEKKEKHDNLSDYEKERTFKKILEKRKDSYA